MTHHLTLIQNKIMEKLIAWRFVFWGLPIATLWSVVSWAQLEKESDSSAYDPWLFWQTPSGPYIIWFFIGLLLTVILIFGMYRVLLKGQVQVGVHPHKLGWTLVALFCSLYLFAVIFTLFIIESISLNIFALVAGILLLALLMLLFLGKVMTFLWFFVVVTVALIAFQLINSVY